MRLRARLLGIAVALTTVACGVVDVAPPMRKPTPGVVVSEYLAILEATHEVACALREALHNNPSDVPRLQSRAADVADAERVAAAALEEVSLPPDLQPLIDELLGNRAGLDAALRAAAGASDLAAVNAALDRLVESLATGAAASNQVREALGLASVPDAACG
jgi:hypothetical protein